MSGETIGWFGKLPSHGDFLQRRAPEAFVQIWDAWLQECIAYSREQLGSDWLQAYLTSPVWRFFLSDGVVGASSYTGVLLPSVDRVGRYFPLTVFAELPAELPPMAVAIHGREWLKQVESLALHALESEDFRIEEFDAALQSSVESLAAIEQYYGVDLGESFPDAARHWRAPMVSADRVAAALIDPLMHLVARRLRPLTLWWTDGSDRVSASCLLSHSMPDARRFVAMLDGDWETAGWAGELGDLQSVTPEQFSYRTASGAATDTGPVRQMNQDRVLDRPDAGTWVVADGMGGHSRGEYASQLIVDVLGSADAAATLDAALEISRRGLNRANEDLVRAALRTGNKERSGSTVVVLCVRQQEWGVLWAGDSRAYLLRNGQLKVLTRDHAGGGACDDDFDAADPPQSTGEITRAVGGNEALMLDQVAGQLQLNDRFLLCSDGLHGTLSHQDLTQLLAGESDAAAAAERLLQAAIQAGSRDNISAVVIDILAAE